MLWAVLVRRTLQFAVVALVATAVLTVLWNLGVGLGELPPLSEDLVERRLQIFEAQEAHYLRWGRWADVATVLLFASFLVVAPFLPDARRARYLIVAGAAVAVVGDMIDVSKLAALDIGRFALDNDLDADFAAANVLRAGLETTSTFVWAAGVLLMSMGLLVLAADAQQSRWRWSSGLLGVAFAAMALTDLDVAGTEPAFWIVSWLAMAIGLFWLIVALAVVPRRALHQG